MANNIKKLRINDSVLVKENDVPPLKWPLTRVTEIIPSSGNRVSVVEIKTHKGIFTRTVTKLCPLPCEN